MKCNVMGHTWVTEDEIELTVQNMKMIIYLIKFARKLERA